MTQYVLAGNVAAISGDFRGLARREHGPSDLKSVEKERKSDFGVVRSVDDHCRHRPVNDNIAATSDFVF